MGRKEGPNDSTDTISTAEIQNCLADASQCTGQLKAIYEAGQPSVQPSGTEEDCEMNPGNCVISSLQVFYDYFIRYRGTMGQLNFPAGLYVPPLGGRDGPAYEFRRRYVETAEGDHAFFDMSGNGDIDQPLEVVGGVGLHSGFSGWVEWGCGRTDGDCFQAVVACVVRLSA